MNTLPIYQAMLSASLKPTALRVMVAILSKTVGYFKTSDDIATSQLEKLTGLRRDKILVALNELKNAGLIHWHKGRYGRVITLNPTLTKAHQSQQRKQPKQPETTYKNLTPKIAQTIMQLWQQALQKRTIHNPKAYLNSLIQRYHNGKLHIPKTLTAQAKYGIQPQGAEDTPEAQKRHDLMLQRLLESGI